MANIGSPRSRLYSRRPLFGLMSLYRFVWSALSLTNCRKSFSSVSFALPRSIVVARLWPIIGYPRSIVVADSQREGLDNKGYPRPIVAMFVPQSLSSSLGLDRWLSLASVDLHCEVVANNRLSLVNRRHALGITLADLILKKNEIITYLYVHMICMEILIPTEFTSRSSWCQ